MDAEDRLAGLAGEWRVARAMRHAGGGTARFEGRAVWSPDGAGLVCIEEGRLCQDGGAFAARRETLWHVQAGALTVRFADGRPFHAIGPDGRAAHDCAPDTYLLRYDFTFWPRWSVRWRVSGPRKDYAALTRYRRDAPAGGA